MRPPDHSFNQDDGGAARPEPPAGPVYDQDAPGRYKAPRPAHRSRTPEEQRRLEQERDLQREREVERERLQGRQPARDGDGQRVEPPTPGSPPPGRGPRPPNRKVATDGYLPIPTPPVNRTRPGQPGATHLAREPAVPPPVPPAAPYPVPPASRYPVVSTTPSASRRGSQQSPPSQAARRIRRPPMPSSNLARNSAIMAGGTFLSRLTGFARVLLVATVLGTSGLGDAYNIANTVPNIVYDLLLGGILSATLVPVFVEEFSKPDIDEGDRAISAVLTAICSALLVISAALYLLAPLVLRFYLLLNHGSAESAERAVGTSLLRMFAPQVFLLGAIVASTALLNARRRFAAPAFSPVANNLIAIAAILATRAVASDLNVGPFRHENKALLVLGFGTTLGYLVQLLLQVPSMRRAGISLWPSWNLRHPAVRRVASLSLWLIGAVISTQIAFNVFLVLAASKSGEATVYTVAYQFFQLPYALLTVSVASALTPDLAERWTKNDRRGFRQRIIAGLRVTLGMLVPAAAGYAIVAQPLIKLAVDYGHVTPSGAHNIASSLALFAIGLPGFSAFILLMRAYQAMQDTRTMFFMYVLQNASNLALAAVLYPIMGVPGLALAWVAPYSVVAVVAAVHLQRRTGPLGGSLTIRALWRILVATALMVVVLLLLGAVLPHGGGHVVVVVRMLVQVGAGALVYVAAARALGIEEVEPVLRLLRLGR